MTTSNKMKFMALYLIPASIVEDWMKTDLEKRKADTGKLEAEVKKWTADHAKMIISTEAGGKTKRVTSGKTSDVKNDIMAYTIIEAESHEAAAKAFADHPHLQIPQSTIEVMEVSSMGAM